MRIKALPTKALWENIMKKAIYAASAVLAAMALAPAAQAADQITNGIDIAELINFQTDTFTASVDATLPSLAGFSLDFAFNVPYDSILTLQVSSTAILNNLLKDVDFTSVIFDGTALTFKNDVGNLISSSDYGPVVVSASIVHHLVVTGTLYGVTGTFGGNINIAPIPEPATWAMMLAGVAAVGTAMRRRVRNAHVAFS